MDIFDFLKKITKEKESEDVKADRISFSDAGSWIENKKKEIELKEKNLFVLIKARISQFTHNLELKINIAKSVDVNVKKAEDKLKSATEDGRSKYTESLEYFLKSLNNLHEDKIEKMVFTIDKLFSDFNKNSHMSYERATILIGKEMGDIKNDIRTFSKDLIGLFDSNKDIIEFSKAISIIEAKLKQVDEIKKDEDRVNEKIISLDKEISDKENESKKIFEEIEKIKKSPEYLGHLRNIRERASLNEDIERDFSNLMKIIDFKALANFHHIFEDKMERVKYYRDKFRINFEKDGGNEILNLLSIAKLNSQEILDKINDINSKREMLKNKTEDDKDNTEELQAHIQKIMLEIDEMKNLKAREKKRLEKFKIIKEEIASKIKKDFEKIGVDLD